LTLGSDSSLIFQTTQTSYSAVLSKGTFPIKCRPIKSFAASNWGAILTGISREYTNTIMYNKR
jgi:hypothetical protein